MLMDLFIKVPPSILDQSRIIRRHLNLISQPNHADFEFRIVAFQTRGKGSDEAYFNFQERQCLDLVLASLWSRKPVNVMDHFGTSQMEQKLTTRFAVHWVQAADAMTYHCKHISYLSLSGVRYFPERSRCLPRHPVHKRLRQLLFICEYNEPPFIAYINLDQALRESTSRLLHSWCWFMTTVCGFTFETLDKC